MESGTKKNEPDTAPWTAAGLEGVCVAWTRFTLKPMVRCRLPEYLGSTLRGALGQALLKTAPAVAQRDFEGADSVPRFIVRPPPPQQAPWTPQGLLCFDLGLINEAHEHFSSWCRAVQTMGRIGLGSERFPFELRRADDVHGARCVWSRGRARAAIVSAPVTLTPWRWTDTVDLWLNTPLTLRRNGRFTDAPNTETIIRAIVRRARGFCPENDDVPYYMPWLRAARHTRIDLSQTEVKAIRRYSNRTNSKMQLRGLSGRIRLVGDHMETLWPLLQIGEQIHCGKYTVFGFGDYTLEPEGREGFIHR